MLTRCARAPHSRLVIRGLLLDLDGTLIDRDGALVAWALARSSRLDREALVAAARRHASADAFIREALPDASVPKATLERELPRFIRPEPRVAERLRSLRGALRVVLLTNGRPRLQRAKIEAAGLGGCFDAVLVSGELGVRKPDPRAFRAALDALGVPARSVLAVGDREAIDLVPARALGCATEEVDGARGQGDADAWCAPLLLLLSRLEERAHA